MKKLSPGIISFLQATGIATYIILISLFLGKADQVFNNLNQFTGPVVFLSLFSLSALICSLLAFTYPAILFWEHKKPKKAIKIIIQTTLFLVIFFLAVLLSLFASFLYKNAAYL
jgi:hypothetical protein